MGVFPAGAADLSTGSDWRKIAAESPPERQRRPWGQHLERVIQSLELFQQALRPGFQLAFQPVFQPVLLQVLQQRLRQVVQPEQQAPRPLLQLVFRPWRREFQ